MPLRHTTSTESQGFTLVEMSIVLVVIGLIIGAIFVGRDLIHAAEIRTQISQIEKYNAAVHTFQTKYNCLPGDCLASQASAYGFFNSTGNTGKGDGNGLIQDIFGHTLPNTDHFLGEPLIFWRHLSDANLIDGNFGASLTINAGPPVDQVASQVSLWVPLAKIGRGSCLAVYSVNGLNYYQTWTPITIAGMALGAGGGWNWAPSITPIEGYAIDSKIDDGLATSGTVQSMSGNNAYYLGQPSQPADNCTVAASPSKYDTGTTNGNSINCDLSFSFQ